MYAGGQREKVVVMSTRDDAAMRMALLMQPLKMPAIVRQRYATRRVSASQNIDISGAAQSILRCGDDVVAQTPQFDDHRKGEVLVGVEEHRASIDKAFVACLVLAQCLINLCRMSRHI